MLNRIGILKTSRSFEDTSIPLSKPGINLGIQITSCAARVRARLVLVCLCPQLVRMMLIVLCTILYCTVLNCTILCSIFRLVAGGCSYRDPEVTHGYVRRQSLFPASPAAETPAFSPG